jgi:hypothetical protein
MRRINLSAALIVLICFFLPWVQLSCGGAKDTLTGLDLARREDTLLWLVPLLACAVIVLIVLRLWRERPAISGVVSAICGLVIVLLMNRQRSRVQDESGIIAAQLTGWFWAAFMAAIAIVVTGIVAAIKRRSREI